MDIARLGFEIDSRPLDRGAQSLDRVAQAGDRAAVAETRQASASDQVARSALSAASATGGMVTQTSRLNAVLASNQTRMLGMQLSQVSQQAMAGGGALRALAIQLPDIGLAFGTIGIAAGVAGGLILPLIGNLFGAKDAAEELDGVSLSGIQSGIGNLSDLERRYEEALVAREATQNSVSDNAIAAIEREIGAKRDLLALEELQLQLQVNALRENVAAQTEEFDKLVRAQKSATDARDEWLEAYVRTPAQNRVLEETQENLEAQRQMGLEIAAQNAELTLSENALDRVGAALRGNTEEQASAAEAAGETALRVVETAGAADQASGAAAALSNNLGTAAGAAAALLSNLGQAPSAIAAIGGQVDAAIGQLESKNRSLTYQLEQGLTASSAAIKAQRDEVIQLALDSGASIDQVAEVGAAFDEQASKAENLARKNQEISKTLSDQAREAAKASAAIGGGGGGGRSSGGGGSGGGLAGSTRAATEAAKDFERTQEAVKKILREAAEEAELTTKANRQLAASYLQDFATGGFSGVFGSLQRDGARAFTDALSSGQTFAQIGQAASSGVIDGLTSALGSGSLGGALSGVGSAISAALPVIGGISTAFNLIKGFSSSEILGAGVRGNIGANSMAEDYERKKKSSFWGLFSSTSTDASMNSELTAMLGDASAAIRREIGTISDTIGGSAQDLGKVIRKFDIDTQGMDAEQATAALTGELEAYREQAAQAALGTDRYTRVGETASDTLGRLTGALSTFNDVQRVLALDTLPKTIANAQKASRALEAAGGSQAFAAGSQIVFDDMRRADQIRSLNQQVNRALAQSNQGGFGERGLGNLRGAIKYASNQGNASRVGFLSGIAPLVAELESMKDARKSEAQAAKAAAQAIRDQERATRAQEAAAKASAIASERSGLMQTLMQGRENQTWLDKEWLSGLDASNKALGQKIIAEREQRAAQEELARASEEATAKIRELIDAVDPSKFATRFGYESALSSAAIGLPSAPSFTAGTVTPATPQQTMGNLAAEVIALRKEVAGMREEQRALQINANADVRAIRLNSDLNQQIGTPAVREDA